ncbi:hypothetical protein HU200_028400 [Digitaria exilis]|uniref:Uncharacterized protein n=1 Tax=Digitaria exilis TaxID=1010633 RepID=A0A835EPU5_9POAL|nr:hypothetical protein HU200_028400 [Digitaria exilis]
MVGKAVTKRAHDITVRSIRVRDAPALDELLSVYSREAQRRREEAQLSVITNAGRFGDLMAAAGVLLLLYAAFLPALFKEPCTAQRLIDTLNDLGMQLRTKAHAEQKFMIGLILLVPVYAVQSVSWLLSIPLRLITLHLKQP